MEHCDTSSDEEDDKGNDESSYSVVNEDDLVSFREKWQRELALSPKNYPSKSLNQNNTLNTENSENQRTLIENKAKNLFLEGVKHEQSGKLYEAIQFYKRAVQLVPDIELRIYESSKVKSRERSDNSEVKFNTLDNDDNITENEEVDGIEECDNNCDLSTKLSRIINQNQCVCFPKFKQNTTHISALPIEIIIHILRWVVSSELDIRSLEMFSNVCRGFYVSARDAEIWRLACLRVWGVNCGSYKPRYTSWRDMYLHRARLRYNGCYISKTTYIRHGENSFQDQFYRPWHLIEYFRYVRFFPGGKVLMLTSTDDAQACVSSLKSRTPQNPSVLIGHYRLRDNNVTVLLKKQDMKSTNNINKRKRREILHDSGEQTFHAEFEIQDHHKKLNSQLSWLTYNIYTRYKDGNEVKTCLNIDIRYPCLRFSRVKSYTAESEALLQ